MVIDWKQVAEQANWGIAIGSADGQRIEQMNPAFAKMHGYTVAELTGAPISDIFAPQVRAEIATHIERAHQQGHYRFESLHLQRDGSIFPVAIDIAAVMNAEGAVLYRIVSVRDISLQKKADEVLQRAQIELALREKFVSNLYANAPIATAICDLDGRYISVNRAMCDMLGYAEQELLAMTFVDVSAPEDAAKNVMLREHLLASKGQRFAMEKRYICKDGRELWTHMAVSLVLDEQGEPLYTIEQMLNINNEKVMEQQLAAARAQRDNLVREVHHRIKNNLQSVTGLLYRQKLANPSLGSMLSGAIQQVETIAIVHGLQARGQRQHLKLCDMLAEIVSATNLLNPEIDGVVLYNELQQPLFIVDNETVPLALVLNELITNAVKHSALLHSGGVTVTMRRIDPAVAEVRMINPVSAGPLPFDFEFGTGLGMGLKLVRSLLPKTGVDVHFSRDADKLITRILLTPPVIHFASAI